MSASYQEQARVAFAVPFVTSRLSIHPWQPGEEKAIANFLNDDVGEFFRWAKHRYIYAIAGSFNEERIRNQVFPAMQAYQDHHCHFELYFRSKEDQQIEGMIEFSRDLWNRDRVTYYLRPSERGKGYASEAYAACVNHAVERGFLGDELYAHTDPDNTLSQKFLRSASFECRGRVITKNNQNKNIEVMAFVRSLSKTDPIRFMPEGYRL